jgi:GDP-4-dehydro-6-deoxy-D-mannose reductase
MNTVLVLGIGGFIGKHFETFISKSNFNQSTYKFFGVARSLNGLQNTGAFTYYQADLLDKHSVIEIIGKINPSYIINLAGTFTAKSFSEYYDVNVNISKIIFDTGLEHLKDLKKVLIVGSAAEYGIGLQNPVTEENRLFPRSEYGLSKCFQTELALYYFRTKTLPVVIARTFNIIGDGISSSLSIGSFLNQINSAQAGGTIQVGNLSTYRDFLPVEDVVKAFWKLLFFGEPGEIYNVCSGVPSLMEDVLKSLIKTSGKNLSYSVDPVKIKGDDVKEIYGSNKKLISLSE